MSHQENLRLGEENRGFGEFIYAANGKLDDIQYISKETLQQVLANNDDVRHLDRKLNHKFDEALRGLDRNSLLISQYSQGLSRKLDNVNTGIMEKFLEQRKATDRNTGLIEDFRNETLDGLFYIARKLQLNEEQTAAARKHLIEGMNAGFVAVQKRMIEHHTKHSKHLSQLGDSLTFNSLVLQAGHEITQKQLQDGFDEMREEAVEHALSLDVMKEAFENKFDDTMKAILANANRAEALKVQVSRLETKILDGFRDLKDSFTAEIADFRAIFEQSELRAIFNPINSTFQMMNRYIQHRDATSEKEFKEAYLGSQIRNKYSEIEKEFKYFLQKHIRTAAVRGDFQFENYEQLRDRLLHHFEMAHLARIFYHGLDMVHNDKSYPAFLKWELETKKEHHKHLEILRHQDFEMREEVARHAFEVAAVNFLKESTADLDNKLTDEEILTLLADIQDDLHNEKWVDTNRSLSQYVVFSTRACEYSMKRYHHHKSHFAYYTNAQNMTFFLYRQRHDLLTEKSFDGDYEMGNVLASKTVKNVLLDRIHRVALVENGAISRDIGQTIHMAADEICAKNCRALLTSPSNCMVITPGAVRFAAIFSPFGLVEIFVGL
ncbi:unnamed protein product, partial [Mesorhabditis belari]|uniref:Uncharacterized protein n=1 Tax=Mesorhabditis belari TaxID=2138241 RepID=A0AAF3ESU4_9BILA